jgi:hypothetical protein
MQIGPEFSSIMLLVRPLQQGVVGPYLGRGAWLPSHLLLDGGGSYPDFFRP